MGCNPAGSPVYRIFQTRILEWRRRGWDVSREQHRNMSIIYSETDHQPRFGCMRQVLGPGALGRPRGIGWRGRWEGGPGWGIHVYPWLIHVNVWQKPLQYCKVISLQLIKINEKKKKKNTGVGCHSLLQGIFPTQGSSPGLLHCRQILYHLSYQGSCLI